MKAILTKYIGEEVESSEVIELPNDYDGDPYGDSNPIVMASNWRLDVIEETRKNNV